MSDSAAHEVSAAGHGAGHGESGTGYVHHGPSYYLIFGALVVLTIVTVAVGDIEGLPPAWALIIAMAIASLKATLVALFFMHLKFEIKPIYIVVGVPVVLTIILILALLPDIAGHAHAAAALAAPTTP